jgi:hypothetical protein
MFARVEELCTEPTILPCIGARYHEESTMNLGLDGRHRDKSGEISRKHGNTLVGTLRKIYGPSFAVGKSDDAKLSDVLSDLHEQSLSQLVSDHGAGHLEDKVRKAALD